MGARWKITLALAPKVLRIEEVQNEAKMKELLESASPGTQAAELRRHLFYETSHSPSLADLVGYEKAKEMVDFCFIANPYYPTPEMMRNLAENLQPDQVLPLQ